MQRPSRHSAPDSAIVHQHFAWQARNRNAGLCHALPRCTSPHCFEGIHLDTRCSNNAVDHPWLRKAQRTVEDAQHRAASGPCVGAHESPSVITADSVTQVGMTQKLVRCFSSSCVQPARRVIRPGCFDLRRAAPYISNAQRTLCSTLLARSPGTSARQVAPRLAVTTA